MKNRANKRPVGLWIGDRLHDLLFSAIAVCGHAVQERMLKCVFHWKFRRPDPWQLSSSDYEQGRYRYMIDLLPPTQYGRVLEVGCAEGAFTIKLCEERIGNEIVGIDISSTALERAIDRCQGYARAHFMEMNAVAELPEGPFDLIYCTEMLYYLTSSQRQTLGQKLCAQLANGGILVTANFQPRARVLHRELTAIADLTCVSEKNVGTAARGYEVAVYRRGGELKPR